MYNLSKVDPRDLTYAIAPVNYIETVMPNADVIKWIMWVNINICEKLETDWYKTTDVKLRIATGMLNNIQSLTDLEKIQIHSNLVRNVRLEIGRIQEERLPF